MISCDLAGFRAQDRHGCQSPEIWEEYCLTNSNGKIMAAHTNNTDFVALVDLIRTPVVVFDSGLELSYCNKSFHQLYPEGFQIEKWIDERTLAILKSHGEVEAETSVPGNSSQKLTWWIQRNTAGDYVANCELVHADSDIRLLDIIKELNYQKYALDESSIVAITDAQGVITYVNRKFTEISKYSKNELIGQDHRLINSGYHPKSFFTNLWATISKGDIWRGEVKNRAKDGSFYWVYTTIVPFCDAKNRPYQYVAIRTDITEGKAAMQQLEEERGRTAYAEKMASLGRMAAGIAHELGNPIAAVTTWLDVVADSVESGTIGALDLSSTLPIVRARAEQMRKIITGMLTFARDGSKDPYESVNLALLVQNVLEYCSYELRKGDVTIDNQLPPEILICDGRQSELSQVVVNLISNAVDALGDFESKWIRITGAVKDDVIELMFVDAGNGIPASTLEKMFDPFYTTKPTGKGTGLGLSISRSIMHEHGGDLQYVDGPNTTFRLVLPKPKRH